MVNRYDPELDSGTWLKSDNGVAVFYEDYKKLEDSLEAERKSVNELSLHSQELAFERDQLNKALIWYEEIAISINKYLREGRTDAILAVVTELSLRAEKILEAKDDETRSD